MAHPLVHTIPAGTHGRYLVSRPKAASTSVAPIAGVLVGFHGQGETAAPHLLQMSRVVGDRPWLLVSVQALHRYNTRTNEIAACWMTREDRVLAIADNVAYVRAVIDEVMTDFAGTGERPVLAFVGFSQGASMAYRAAALAGRQSAAVIALAGDLPPDVAIVAATLPPVLIGRGTRDAWFTAARAEQDLRVLASAGIVASEHVFDGGHVWHETFIARAGHVLDGLVPVEM